jgi:O-antigen/teichoic acid export membrane protein
MLNVIAITSFPLLIGMFVVADDLILTVYGSQWKDAVLPLRILIIYALRYTVGAPASVVYKAVGRPDISFKLGTVIIPFYLASIWIGSSYGITGVAAGVTLVRTVFGLIGFEITARCVKCRFRDVIRPMVPAFLASLWMGVVVLAAKVVVNRWLPGSHLLSLLMLVSLGGLTYLVLLRTRFNTLAHELAQVSAPLLGPFQVFVVKALKAN